MIDDAPRSGELARPLPAGIPARPTVAHLALCSHGGTNSDWGGSPSEGEGGRFCPQGRISKFLSVNILALSGALAVSVLFQVSAANFELPPKKFSLKAPSAKTVEINAEWSTANIPMERAEDGTWSVTLASVPAGVWSYSFLVDGLNVLDPGNPEIIPQYSELKKNVLHIPASPPAFWDWQDVPHGVVHSHDYQSKVLGQRRQLLVYTPSGYNVDPAQRYPLLVLQHGSGGCRSSWVGHGRANWIFDNLIAAGKAKPMVVLMMDGHSSGTYQGREIKGVESFGLELLEDALPLVEKNYRLAELPENRAIVGLSMGARQSTTVGLGNLDRFGWVGGFSAISYPDSDILKSLLASPEETNKKLKLLWLAWGSSDARAVKAGEPFVEELEKAGIKLQWKMTEGGHAWPVWQRYLVDILPLLFRLKKGSVIGNCDNLPSDRPIQVKPPANAALHRNHQKTLADCNSQ